ncbi:hypothetical protein ALC53_05355 [Atta colombica]|uniref:Uncharacterized protein n=1 Tax=Atta colombica TaxID=520822 RepID=A0A195BHG7_9HYME|nr:hypothetical protein ALC53_05355 [Atta colombica]
MVLTPMTQQRTVEESAECFLRVAATVRAWVGNRRSGRQCLNAFRYEKEEPMPVLRLPSATVEEKGWIRLYSTGADRSRRQILEMRSPLTRHAAAPADESTRRIEERERKISIRDAVNSHLAG